MPQRFMNETTVKDLSLVKIASIKQKMSHF